MIVCAPRVSVQDKIERAGGEPLRKQKEKVASLRVCLCVYIY